MKNIINRKYAVRDIIYVIAAILLVVISYFFFRLLYFSGSPMPFAQEMILVFLGAVATIYLTSALLNRQTELELRKEGRVIILQQKSDVYMACIETVARIVEGGCHDAKLIDELRILNHKLAVFASSSVIQAQELLLQQLLSSLSDGQISNADGNEIMNKLTEMTSAMREDILHEIGLEEADMTRKILLRNSANMEKLDDLEDKLAATNETTRQGGL